MRGWLQLFEDHRTGHPRRGIAPGLCDEFVLDRSAE